CALPICAKMRSFNCFTLITGTAPPGRRANACHPTELPVSTRCAAGRQSRTGAASQGPDVAPVDGGIYPHALQRRRESRRRLPAALCRSRSLAPEARQPPDVLAGRDQERTQLRRSLGSRGGVSGGAAASELEPQQPPSRV